MLASPVLSEDKFHQLLALDDPDYAHAVIDLNYDPRTGLRGAIEQVCDRAVQAVARRQDRPGPQRPGRGAAASCPSTPLLATGAVHHRLIREGLRCEANIVVETATARDPHHFAVLIGYGATAVYPYLAYEALLGHGAQRRDRHGDPGQLLQSYRKGINKGLYKIISKMGISTITSYRGAQLFESVGLHREVVDLCFTGTTSRIQGAHFDDLESDQRVLAGEAWNPRAAIRQGGLLKYVYSGEYHAYNPDVVRTLHEAVQSGDYDKYREFSTLVQRAARSRPCATCWPCAATPSPSPSRRWSLWRPSCRASTPPACPWAPCRRRPTRPWPSP